MNTITATLDGKGITRPPVAPVIASPADYGNRIIVVTRGGLAVVSYVGKSGAEVRHV